jgi:beta-glucosidase
MGHRGVELHVQGKPVRLHIAPGLTLEEGPLNQVRHHTILAHGLAIQALRAAGRQGIKVGPAENMPHALPVIDVPEHVKAAEAAARTLNRYFFVPMLEGRFDDAYLKAAGKGCAEVHRRGDENHRLAARLRRRQRVHPDVARDRLQRSVRLSRSTFNDSHPKMFSSWHRLAPESQYWSPRLLNSLWKPKEIYITENGCAASDVVAADGNVYDSDRLMYLRNAMMWQQRATSEGIPLKGNFYWSALDNFEWTDGFGARFGVVHVDFKTQNRTPKMSASWFREAARRNAVV